MDQPFDHALELVLKPPVLLLDIMHFTFVQYEFSQVGSYIANDERQVRNAGNLQLVDRTWGLFNNLVTIVADN
jgi:hypothetical protein